MLQASDFKEKQILLLESKELTTSEIKINNQNLQINFEDGRKEKVRLQHLVAVYVIGDATLTTKLIEKLLKTGGSLFLLKQNMQTYAAFNAVAEGNYLLRNKQYHFPVKTELDIAKQIVLNKIKNQLALLRSIEVKKIQGKSLLTYKKDTVKKINEAVDFASLRGLEGSVSKDFFALYFESIDWRRRVPRGKVDEINILLDIGYTYLFNFVDSILRLFGFDTYKGVYHQLFFQRKSLSCDLMEPFRCIIDRAVLKMYNLSQFDKSDFSYKNGSYYLKYQFNSKYSRIFLQELLKHKMEIYGYIRSYYYHIMNEDNLGEFKIR
ncbi:type V CRISPR-associated endonuclease Cas1 [Candidatus Uhrbacteria bacterium CG_4_10_14_0_2_um_filter_41_7]|uniref:CRISPR-associated endonuclease Cas1 n=1 Tax=Candidatus Uhrbacteria bacterium CG_4_9_14_3_um_filter_41_35 TaxID=1975034 RepID=A0A2M7XDN4_9BACT|nr:MAG: type V CRISPR-associated endonuclease Cas1 [Candidatus Uhrbacteria bacterium CG11_big_fil_rev_8_21_14_0_20_41_9]PIZ53798.1 MAG: type V CRISPR-associated endonuclease Cas1 [Candidatus Uhrbacteria bacterium CG_4_10_14_0_2_um_filter_41_7]PJA45991.1 MAG: type V CRISPR-associated endonuclease Cas1 [Candidatus Uhrbacteria bacterium CG_4_9_14_3_um_filter_41_35]